MPYSFQFQPDMSPVCPIDALPEPLRGAALLAIQQKGVPPACALTDVIAATGAVVHCGFNCQTPDGDVLPATINTCAVAPSASGKGRSMQFFFAPLLNALKERALEPALDAARIPRVDCMVNRITFRALVEHLNGMGMNLTIQREEGASFLKSDLFKNDTDALTQLWSGDPPIDHHVRGKKLTAVDGRCSFGFRIQPELMYDHFKRGNRLTYNLGFWPRTIAGCHDPKKFPWNDTYLPPVMAEADASAYFRRYDELMKEINGRSGLARITVQLDVEAVALLHEISFRMRNWIDTHYADIREAAGRAWENTLRVAVVMHVFCRRTGPVTGDMILRAWKIVEWSLSQHRLIFVEGIRPQVKPEPFKTFPSSKLPKQARQRNADMQFMLEAISARSFHSPGGRVYMSEVLLLTGFHKTRFLKTLGWLVSGYLVIVEGTGENMTARVVPPRWPGISYAP